MKKMGLISIIMVMMLALLTTTAFAQDDSSDDESTGEATSETMETTGTTETASQVPEFCPGAPPPLLNVGQTAEVAQSYSSLRAAFNSQVVIDVMYRVNGDQFTILDGPLCAAPHYWYQVSHNGQTGWVTNGQGSTYWITAAGTDEPDPGDDDDMDDDDDAPVTACPGAPVARLGVGATGGVAQTYSSLRASIGSPIVLDLMYSANNDQFTVLDGPVCAGPHYWYQVSHNGQTGWVTEGTGATYWLVPLGITDDHNETSSETETTEESTESTDSTDSTETSSEDSSG